MGETIRNCFHILMVPVWRRRYLFVSVGILCVVFIIYSHYAPENDPGSTRSSASGNQVSFTAGSLSAKFPVDMNSVNVDSLKQPPEVETKRMDSVQKMYQGKEDEQPYPDRTLRQPINSMNKDETLHSDQTGYNTPYKIREQTYEVQFGTDKNSKNSLFPANTETNKHKSSGMNENSLWHHPVSLKERFSADGIKPTSIAIKPQEPILYNLSNVTKTPPYVPSLRLVHFDLKGAPPKVSYFKSIFPLIKAAGANGIIMEYEDTFPFWGPLAPAAAENAYKQRDIKYILEKAKANDLIVIPLVQTFGHLEFVLKLPEFKHLREVPESPQALCPTNNGSLLIVKTMIDQILSLHPDSKWLHIGSDEVFQLGYCKRCSRYERNSLFLAYVKKVAKHVRDSHGIIPIMWDDMLRHISVPELEKYKLGKLVEPMAWTYVEDVYLFLPDSLWEKYRNVFPYMWSASAFKGAFGETLTVPDAKRHLENNKAWVSVMKEQKKNFQEFRGIAITGWQRYDHFASLCELLPAGLPSLILTLLTVSQGGFNDQIFPKMQEILDCSSRKHYHLDLDHDPYMWRALGVCFFPGSSVFRLTLRHNDVTKSVDKFLHDTTVHKGWLTTYNVNHNFTSPLRITELLREYSYHNSSLQMLFEAAVKSLREVFDDYTVSEWIELNVSPYMNRMKKLWDDSIRLRGIDVWPRRPLSKSVKIPPPPNIDFGFVKS